MIPPVLFLLKIALGIQGLLWFHKNFRIICASYIMMNDEDTVQNRIWHCRGWDAGELQEVPVMFYVYLLDFSSPQHSSRFIAHRLHIEWRGFAFLSFFWWWMASCLPHSHFLLSALPRIEIFLGAAMSPGPNTPVCSRQNILAEVKFTEFLKALLCIPSVIHLLNTYIAKHLYAMFLPLSYVQIGYTFWKKRHTITLFADSILCC